MASASATILARSFLDTVRLLVASVPPTLSPSKDEIRLIDVLICRRHSEAGLNFCIILKIEDDHFITPCVLCVSYVYLNLVGHLITRIVIFSLLRRVMYQVISRAKTKYI